MLSPAQFALRLREAAARTRGHDLTDAVHECLEHVAQDARDSIGEERPEWPELAESTIAEKERLGYPTPHPLERTGLLRESISSEAKREGNAVVGIVASTDPVMSFHEFGTSRMPARPVLAPPLVQAEHVIGEAMGQFLVKVITDRG